jgi:hypothetical protein
MQTGVEDLLIRVQQLTVATGGGSYRGELWTSIRGNPPGSRTPKPHVLT